ncbi:UDP-D-galactose (glucosyl)lipopolysaccharide-1,6-D-galactosyltransferase [Ligilactobacillus murinus DSM 20452 = NBRC 14221]|uniref:UDP-D-galactose (Glucosyl)lipopolysaccharide-1,6-D-galactosyltransferase n=1 Tax=Ligilactobacillus murinus DSM 20452 = NBRC 14221 TaxID=1423772 RepID=A0A0R2BN10_9LACO|nr:glycosyltransferase [Ligilactobacillus murinus]KRM76707.1 UDP-D-galactose (glucosyl)lipopolysaccharide-1,6-D-galactosyltransferase [Ligilactobacillus murinus DSM 20452 = NBRC 14221]
MKLKFLCMELSGTGGTETVLVKVLNQLCEHHKIELILTNAPPQQNFLTKLDSRIQISICSGKINKPLTITKKFLLASADTCFISLSPKMIKLGAKIRSIFKRKYKIISWIHFSLDDQDMFNAKTTVPLADGHLAISSTIKEQLLSYGVPDEKISLIFNPIDPIATSIPTSNSPLPKFFYAGRVIFEGQKNLKEMIYAISKTESATLDVFGTGEDVKRCQEYARELNVDQRIIWHGYTPELWHEIKEKPTALLMTSTYEGLPMIMLEAIAHGIPVICSEFNGYHDVLKTGINGFSYPLHDVSKLVEQMEHLEHTQLTEQAIKQSIQAFYPKKYFDNFEATLKNFVN